MSCLPYAVWDCWWLAPLALALDMRFGDPELPWRHPVCLVGALLDALEAPARRFMRGGGPQREKARGDRCPGSAEVSLRYLWPKDGYDLCIDNGKVSAADNAEKILAEVYV